MHRNVTAWLKEGRYCEAIEAARNWIECTSYAQLVDELAHIADEERAPLVTLLRDVLLMGGPLGGPLWGAPVLLHYTSPGRSEAVLQPPEAPPDDVVRSGWLPESLLDSDEPLGFACKPASLTLPTGEMSAAVLVLQTEDAENSEAPELDDGHLADVVSPTRGERVVLCGRFVLPWIEALEAARIMLREVGDCTQPRPHSAAQPIFLGLRTATWAAEAGKEFARIVRKQAADAADIEREP